MQQFTLKDFIETYNCCFMCHQPMTFKIKIQNPARYAQGYYAVSPKVINQKINNLIYEFELDVSYNQSLILQINSITNKFNVSSINAFDFFIKSNLLSFTFECKNCTTYFIMTDYLNFDNSKNYLKPITVNHEFVSLTTDKCLYNISSFYQINCSMIEIYQKSNIVKSSTSIKVPLIKINYFKNKNEILNKIKTIIAFS